MNAVPSFALPSSLLPRVQPAKRACPRLERPPCDVCFRRYRYGIAASLGGAGTAGFPPSTPGDAAAALAREIASAFVVACTRTDVPYAKAIREFVSLSLDAYARGISLSALRSSLQREALLASDEVELRDVWISLVYKTLRAVRFPVTLPDDTGNFDMPPPPDQFDAFVRSIVAAKKEGSDLKRIQLELSVSSTRSSPLESAILSQSTRLVVATLDVADERRQEK